MVSVLAVATVFGWVAIGAAPANTHESALPDPRPIQTRRGDVAGALQTIAAWTWLTGSRPACN